MGHGDTGARRGDWAVGDCGLDEPPSVASPVVVPGWIARRRGVRGEEADGCLSGRPSSPRSPRLRVDLRGTRTWLGNPIGALSRARLRPLGTPSGFREGTPFGPMPGRPSAVLAGRDFTTKGAKAAERWCLMKSQAAWIPAASGFLGMAVHFVRPLEFRGSPPKILRLTCGNTSESALQRIHSMHLSRALDLLEAGESLVEIRTVQQREV